MKYLIALFLLGAFAVNAAPPPFLVSIPKAAEPEPEVAANVDYTLGRNFLPEEFTISLKTYLADIYKEERFTFNGDCAMKFKYVGTTTNEKKLVIHAKNLNGITYNLFEVVGGVEVSRTIQASKPDPVTDKVEITLATAADVFKTGTIYILKSTYVGQMDDDMHGFYKSQYTDDKGNQK